MSHWRRQQWRGWSSSFPFSSSVSLMFNLSPCLQHEALSLEEIRVQVVQVLGRLGGQISKNLITGDLSLKHINPMDVFGCIQVMVCSDIFSYMSFMCFQVRLWRAIFCLMEWILPLCLAACVVLCARSLGSDVFSFLKQNLAWCTFILNIVSGVQSYLF